jgi:photoactive yellow protein
MSFVPQTVIDTLTQLTRTQADAQAFGVVQVTDEGVVTLYNRWESELAGVAVSAAEGRNFFSQVAPCTNNRLVFGKFKEGVQKGQLDAEFNYTFTYKMKPTNVALRLFRHVPSATNWVFVGLR